MSLKDEFHGSLLSTIETNAVDRFSRFAWTYFKLHEFDTLFKVFGIFAVRVRDTRPLFEKIFGPEPTS